MSAIDDLTTSLQKALEAARSEGYMQALADVVDLIYQLSGHNEWREQQQAEPVPEPQPDVPTKVCKDCGRELPATEEFFRIHGRSGKPMQPCRECFHKSRQQPLTCSHNRPKFGTSLAERYPKCPRTECHMRRSCGLIDKPTECESFMKLHEGEE